MDVIPLLNAALAGRYAIEHEAGAGGMATVYAARDLRHGRRVALKVLDPELGMVLGADRFLSEIQVTAHLQHPNLLPLFDSGQADHLLFYVMPFVEGESLRDRLNREKQLPIEDAVRIATAVAGALDYAHSQGVIHRDLKPENILLQAGQPVLADFGIALAVAKAGGTRVTQTGISLGTPRYMSPEQATGDRVIDGRTDIYSLGAVLYEMLTGDPPHTGSTAHATIAKILTEPAGSVRIFREMVPAHVDAAVLQALAKLPADRFATGREFSEALAGVRASAVAPVGRGGGKVRPSAWRRAATFVPWIVAAVSLAGLAASRLQRVAPLVPKVLEIALPDSMQSAGQPVMSRDGRLLAFVAQSPAGRGIYVRSLSDTAARYVAGTEGASIPSISPDDKWIAFRQSGSLKRVAVDGGPVFALVDSFPPAAGIIAWTGDGDIVFQTSVLLWRLKVGAGKPMRLPEHQSQKDFLRFDPGPVIPGTDILLVRAYGTDHSDKGLALFDLGDGRVELLGVRGGNPQFVSPNLIAFQRASALFAVPLSVRTRKVTGPEMPLLDGAASFCATDDGTLVYLTAIPPSRRMVFVDRRGHVTSTPVPPGPYDIPRVSPDGRSVLFKGGGAIWNYAIPRGTVGRFLAEAAQTGPSWWPDGSRVIYDTYENGAGVVTTAPFKGTDNPSIILRDSFDLGPVSVGPPGTYIVAWRSPRLGSIGADILFAPLDSLSAARPLMTTPATERHPMLSRDGHHVAYTSNQSGRDEIYVQALPGRTRPIQVSVDGGRDPIWAHNGRELFYRSRTHLMSAAIRSDPEFDVRRRDTLFVDHFAFHNYAADFDVLPGDNQFVMFQSDRPPPRRMFAIVNWPALLATANVKLGGAR